MGTVRSMSMGRRLWWCVRSLHAVALLPWCRQTLETGGMVRDNREGRLLSNIHSTDIEAQFGSCNVMQFVAVESPPALPTSSLAHYRSTDGHCASVTEKTTSMSRA